MKYTTITAAALAATLLLPSLAEAQNALQKGLKILNAVSDSLNQASGSPQGQQPQAQSPSPFAAPPAPATGDGDGEEDEVDAPAAGSGSLSLGGKPVKDEANDDEDDEPKASSGSFSFGKPKSGAAETVEVTAKGQGESVEAAKKDAVRNAIKQAVGELVGSKTLVENDELVEDKILTLSNAMVENAFYGDAKSIGDGLFEVPVKAVVKKGKLNQELEKIGVTKGAVKGDSLAAKLFSGRERVANAEKFLAERFKDFPGNVVEGFMLAKKDGSPDIEVNEDSGHVFANVGLRVNMENYLKWTQALCELLGQICLAKEETTVRLQQASRAGNSGATVMTDDGDYSHCEAIPLRTFPKTKVLRSSVEDGTKEPVTIPVLVATPRKAKRDSWPATIFYLDLQMWNALSKTVTQRYPEQTSNIEVILKDDDGEPVCSGMAKMTVRQSSTPLIPFFSGYSGGYFQEIKAESCRHRYGILAKMIILPTLYTQCNDSSPSGCAPTLTIFRSASPVYKKRIDLGAVAEDDLEDIKGYEVKVEYKYKEQN